MGDRIVVMDKGYIAQVGTPRIVYQKPNTPFVANFIGIMNFLSGVVINSTTVQCGNLQLQTSTVEHSPNDKILIAIRPEDIHVLHESQDSANLANVLTAEIENIEFLGSVFQLLIRPDGDAKETLTCEVSLQESRYLDLSLNSKIRIQLPPDLIRVFPAENSP
jgi:ABC-type Fe3+/spermidine/putrescine transport system ATPase subunit